jgi:hypothetical protein
MIIDDQVARLAELEGASIGQGNDRMPTGSGDDPIAHIDGSSRRYSGDNRAALHLNRARGGRDGARHRRLREASRRKRQAKQDGYNG